MIGYYWFFICDTHTILIVWDLVPAPVPDGYIRILCWWLFGYSRWYLEIVELFHIGAYHITILELYWVGRIFLRWHWVCVGCKYGVDHSLQWFIILWVVSDLCSWGIMCCSWVWVWSVGAQKYASIVGEAKVCVGVTAWIKLVFTGVEGVSGHRVV